MTQPQYCLSWEEHPKNICHGLSYLQQNGEFVDMTLAADGHIVKVHQVIIALSSPYLKHLIASAQCPHPVIVLNKISHRTLTAILEYIYTGEVLVAIEDIRELVDAAKDLHIKGLQEMNLSVPKQYNEHKDSEMCLDTGSVGKEDISCFQIQLDSLPLNETENVSLLCRESDGDSVYEVRLSDDKTVVSPTVLSRTDTKRAALLPVANTEKTNNLQYTVSNQGSLQLILNRFVYYLKHTKRDQTRQWRCVDYLNRCRCPAIVVTRDHLVLQRIHAHKHPFHDKKILKKVKENNVFSELFDAEQTGLSLARSRDDQDSE